MARAVLPALVLSVVALMLLPGALAGVPERTGAAPPFAAVLPRYGELRTGNAPVGSEITIPRLLWSYPTDATALGSPLVGDIDRDGSPDVVFGETRLNVAATMGSRRLYALEADGTLKWTAPAKYDVGVKALVDLEGDGAVEVIAGEGCHCQLGGLNLYVLNGADGSLKWMATSTFWGMGHEGAFAVPNFLDVNGDGVLDLILSFMDRYVRALDGRDGAVLWRSAEFSHYLRTSGAMADLDGDGDPDVTGWAESGMFRVLDALTGATVWERDYGCNAPTTPAIGELDGDAGREIAIPVAGCSNLGDPGSTIVVNGEDGSVIWANRRWDSSYRSPALVDVDQDGRLDVIDGDSDSAMVVAYRGRDGVILWETPMPAPWASGPIVVAEVDGDGRKEALAGSDGGLVSMNSRTGMIEWVYAVPKVRGEAHLADLTGDGLAEIAFAGVGSGVGTLYVLTTPAEGRFEPRTIGYWRYQCRFTSPSGEHVGIQPEFLALIGARSKVFPAPLTKADACRTLQGPRGDDMLARAKQQLMALWLNVASGKVSESVAISLPGLTDAGSVGQAILEIEMILLNPASTRADWERAKTIADQINNGRGV